MFSFSLLTPPQAEPITLAEAKAAARVDSSQDDALITTLITSARQWAESYTGRAFITQTWQMAIDMLNASDPWWDGAHEGPILGIKNANQVLLARAPLQSVTKVEIFDETDAATVWPSANYFVDTKHEPGRLVLRSGATWPCPSRLANGMIVTYVAGYGPDSSSVPEPIKTAIRELVAHFYQHRGDDTPPTNCFAAQALLNPYRIRIAG